LGPLLAALVRQTPVPVKTAESTAVLTSALDKGYEILLDALGFEPASVDVLIARTGLKADAVASMLLILELEARIDACPGGLYVRRLS
jgi:DNA processing protein